MAPYLRSLLLGAVAAAFLLVACGGGGNSGETTLDPKKADELAHLALLTPADLPGPGWTVSKNDEFDDDSDLADTPACEEINEAEDKTEAEFDKKRAGRAQRELERPLLGALTPVSVDVQIDVFKDGKGLSKVLDEARSMLERGIFRDCIGDTFKGVFGATTNVKQATPLADSPSGGFSAAVEAEITSLRTTLYLETHAWVFGNVGVTLDLSGPKQAVTADLVKAALEKTQAGLERASGPNPPTAAPVATRAPATPATTRGATPGAAPTGGPAVRGRLQDLNSYRYAIKMDGFGGPLTDLQSALGPAAGTSGNRLSFEVSGAFVKPDRGQQTIKLGALTVTQVIIGRQEWTVVGTLITGPQTTSPTPEDISLAARLWDEGLAEVVAQFGCSGRETVNGVATRKCGLSQPAFNELRTLFSSLGGSSEISSVSQFIAEAWLADVGDHPVRLRIEMAGKDQAGKDFQFSIIMEVTDVNSTSIQVNPPR